MYHISNLAYSIRTIEENTGANSDAEEENLALKRLEADLSTELKSPERTKCDLFSEIHLNELKKLEKQLEVIESEKTHLTANLREAHTNLDKSQNELQNFMARVSVLAAHVDVLQNVMKQYDNNESTGKALVQHQNESNFKQELHDYLNQYINWFALSSKEVDTLKFDLNELQKGFNYSDAMTSLRNEITNLKNKLISMEQKSMDVQSDFNILTNISENAGQSLSWARSTLITMSDDLAQLYHLMCTVNSQIPSRVLLDHKSDEMR